VNHRVRVVAIVCIAIFAFTVIASASALAMFDAQTPIDALFSSPAPAPAAPVEDVVVPTSPVVYDVQSPRPPPLA
jgi:hypothetical protein